VAAEAADGRDLSGLRARLDGFKVRLVAPAEILPEILRSAS
jgi:hypothetical protein